MPSRLDEFLVDSTKNLDGCRVAGWTILLHDFDVRQARNQVKKIFALCSKVTAVQEKMLIVFYIRKAKT